MLALHARVTRCNHSAATRERFGATDSETSAAAEQAADATTKTSGAQQVRTPPPTEAATHKASNRSEERFSLTPRSRIRSTKAGEINLLLNLERSHTRDATPPRHITPQNPHLRRLAMTTGPAEPATAKELKKQLRRLKHVGNGSSSEATALEERLRAREAWEKDLATVKGSITEKQLLPNADVSKEIAELQASTRHSQEIARLQGRQEAQSAEPKVVDPMAPPSADSFEPGASKPLPLRGVT